MKARPLTLDETDKISTFLVDRKEWMYYALFALMITTGARITEALLLRRGDVLGEEHDIKGELRRQKLKSRPTKYKKYISNFITPELRDILRLWMAYQAGKYGKGAEDKYLFASRWGNKPIERKTAWEKLKRIAVQVKISRSGVSLHSFRKTFARTQYEAFLKDYPDDPLKAVKKVQTLLGHCSLECTIHYLDLEQDNPQKHASLMGRYVGNSNNINIVRKQLQQRIG